LDQLVFGPLKLKVTRAQHNGLERWRVSWEERRATKRRFFATKQEASDFAAATLDELKSQGDAWNALPAATRAELVDCYIQAKEKGYSVSEACRRFEQEGPRTTGKITLSDLAVKFLAAKRAKNIRPLTLRILGITITKFLEGRGLRQASSATPDEITAWLDSQKWGQWRRRGAIIDLANLFAWAERNHFVDRNPVDGVERPIIEHGTPEILRVEDAARLLKLCRSKYKALLPWLAVSLFAGLRAGEVERLKWENIGADHIRLASDQTKGRARRLVTINDTLKAWLAACTKRKGMVCVAKHGKKAHALRKAFGGLPKNVLRHSFISYALAAGKTVDNVATESGTSAAIIFRHYREVVTPEDAKAFWELGP
jgi:integrase